MDGMTNEQYNDQKKTLILLILEMMKNSKNLEEAEEKIKALLKQVGLQKQNKELSGLATTHIS